MKKKTHNGGSRRKGSPNSTTGKVVKNGKNDGFKLDFTKKNKPKNTGLFGTSILNSDHTNRMQKKYDKAFSDGTKSRKNFDNNRRSGLVKLIFG